MSGTALPISLAPVLRFFVAGEPKTAGSKRAFVIPGKNGGKPRAIVTDDNVRSRDWKTDVQKTAVVAYGMTPLWMGPMEVRLTFYRLRPKGHYRTGKNSHLLRDDVPAWPHVIPDVLKLARGVEDALSGIIWRDDAQIVGERLDKRFGDKPGVEVEIYFLPDLTPAEVAVPMEVTP